jgi:hypothetical protein
MGNQVCQQIHRGNDEYYSKILGNLPAGDLDRFLKTFETIAGSMTRLNRGQ